MFNPSIFKAYDIRGIYGVDFDDDFAYRLGLAYCRLRREESGPRATSDNMRIVAGRDMRLSSPALYGELLRGLRDGGADVIDIGLTSTPMFYFAVAHYKYDGGIQVSASHNPKDYNGFKLVRQLASPIGVESGLVDLKRILLDGLALTHETPGSINEHEGVLKDQMAYDFRIAGKKPIKPFHIVMDTANAMGGPYFDQFFNHLPQLRIEWLNRNLDGFFPAHEADPYKPENVAELCTRVKASGADFGIATDGDGDRIFFIDETGTAIEPGIMRAILAELFLKESPGATIAYDIRPGRITYDVIIANGGQPLVTKVGHTLIKEAMIDAGAYFAGESSGHFFLNMEGEGCYEVPGIVALKLMMALSDSGLTLSEYAHPFKKYFHSGEINIPVTNPGEIIERIAERYKDGRQSRLDGLTVEYGDYWFNVRGAQTEPLIRLNLEAIDETTMIKYRDEIRALMQA